jgi:ATP-dependent protease HslVU (ClpYQ) ATPase subunit
MHLSAILNFAGQAMQGGMNVVNEQNMYNIMASMVKNMGFQNVGDFLTDPAQVPQEPSSEEKAEEMEQKIKQGELQIKAAEIQIKQQRLQLDAAKLQADTAMKVAEIKLETEQKRPVGIG